MNKCFLKANQKGFDAANNGQPRTSCPYKDIRAGKYDNLITFSRAWRRAWFEGFDSVIKNELPKERRK